MWNFLHKVGKCADKRRMLKSCDMKGLKVLAHISSIIIIIFANSCTVESISAELRGGQTIHCLLICTWVGAP